MATRLRSLISSLARAEVCVLIKRKHLSNFLLLKRLRACFVPSVVSCSLLSCCVVFPFPLAVLLVQRRIAEGAAMLRTKGEAGTGNVVEAVRHARSVQKEIRMVSESERSRQVLDSASKWSTLIPCALASKTCLIADNFP